ncbi:hypothetical protein Tco_0189447 [Tanacetum coccineum]
MTSRRSRDVDQDPLFENKNEGSISKKISGKRTSLYSASEKRTTTTAGKDYYYGVHDEPRQKKRDDDIFTSSRGLFKDFGIQDIDDMLLLLVQGMRQNLKFEELLRWYLDDVRTALNDRLKGIRMEYLPQTFWSQRDKANARAMIQAIDKRLKIWED